MFASGGKTPDPVAAGFDSKVRLEILADQVITTGTVTQVLFDDDVYDVLSEFDSDNNRIVVAATGWYDIKYGFNWQNPGDAKVIWNWLLVNAAVVPAGTCLQGDASGSTLGASGSIDIKLTAGDLITMEVYHLFGANLNLRYSDGGGSALTMHRFA